MKLYRGYSWYSWKRYPYLFRMFHNPYHFDKKHFILWKYYRSFIYQKYLYRFGE